MLAFWLIAGYLLVFAALVLAWYKVFRVAAIETILEKAIPFVDALFISVALMWGPILSVILFAAGVVVAASLASVVCMLAGMIPGFGVCYFIEFYNRESKDAEDDPTQEENATSGQGPDGPPV